MSKFQSVKGDNPRPYNPKTYGENYDAIFRKKQNNDQTRNKIRPSKANPSRKHDG